MLNIKRIKIAIYDTPGYVCQEKYIHVLQTLINKLIEKLILEYNLLFKDNRKNVREFKEKLLSLKELHVGNELFFQKRKEVIAFTDIKNNNFILLS